MQPQTFSLLKSAVSRSFNQAADTYDASAILQREVADRLLERLDYMKISPKVIVDLGSGTGYCTQHCQQRYPDAVVIGVDIAHAMLKHAQTQNIDAKWCCADAESLPIASHSVDLVISNLMFQWISDLPKAFEEIRRILKPNGLLLFTTKGPDTLKELRHAWQQIDEGYHVHDFLDMHDIGDTLLHARFSDPVMDAQTITVHYSEVKKLLRDLKQIGAHNLHQNRPRGLLGKQKFQAFLNAYDTQRTPTGKYPATYEIIFGHAWMPAGEVTYSADQQGQVSIPVSALRLRY